MEKMNIKGEPNEVCSNVYDIAISNSIRDFSFQSSASNSSKLGKKSTVLSGDSAQLRYSETLETGVISKQDAKPDYTFVESENAVLIASSGIFIL